MESLFTETIESIYPMNNVAYHFIKKVDSGNTSEMIIYSNKTFNNLDELKKNIDIYKDSIDFFKYSNVFITCCTLNSDYRRSRYLWRIDCVNNREIYKFTIYEENNNDSLFFY